MDVSYDLVLGCGCQRWLMNVTMDHLRVWCDKHQRMSYVMGLQRPFPSPDFMLQEWFITMQNWELAHA